MSRKERDGTLKGVEHKDYLYRCGVMKRPGSSLEQQGERRGPGDYQSTVRGGLGKEGPLDGSCGL